MKNSFVELNARERVNALLDNGRELIDPFDQIIAPSLPAQGIVPKVMTDRCQPWHDQWQTSSSNRYGRKIPRWRYR